MYSSPGSPVRKTTVHGPVHTVHGQLRPRLSHVANIPSHISIGFIAIILSRAALFRVNTENSGIMRRFSIVCAGIRVLGVAWQRWRSLVVA